MVGLIQRQWKSWRGGYLLPDVPAAVVRLAAAQRRRTLVTSLG